MRTSTRWHGHFNFVVDIPKKGGSASELGVAPEPRPTVVEKRVALHAEILPIDFQLFFHLVVPPIQARKARNGNRGSCCKLVRDACVDLVEVVKVFQFQRNECSSQQAKRRELLQLQGGAVEFVDRTSVIHRSLHQSDGRFRVQTPTWEASSGEPHCALSRPSSLSSLSAMSRRGPSRQQGASRTGVCIAFQHI